MSSERLNGTFRSGFSSIRRCEMRAASQIQTASAQSDPKGPKVRSRERAACNEIHALVRPHQLAVVTCRIRGRRLSRHGCPARSLAPWTSAWSLSGFEHGLNITFSSRFRTSFGRCAPRSKEIRLAAFLLTGPRSLFREVLCHEAAHAAAYELHGAVRRPHGPEWRALMEAAGFEGRARLPASALPEGLHRRVGSGQLWEHRCPVCRAARVARRRVPEWRCAGCRAVGLEGDLVVVRVGVAERGMA